jgi:hypothetical protein
MAATTILVPGKDSVSINVGDTLTINFTEDCCFCCSADQADNFDPALPIGDHHSGDSWSGVALLTGTIEFHHQPYGQECGSKRGVTTSPRTISVGD